MTLLPTELGELRVLKEVQEAEIIILRNALKDERERIIITCAILAGAGEYFKMLENATGVEHPILKDIRATLALVKEK